jgi:hypothetical protein
LGYAQFCFSQVWEELIAPPITRPGFANFVVIAIGWRLTRGLDAVTEVLVEAQVEGRRHHEAFHRFFSRGTWDPNRLGMWVVWRIVAVFENVGAERIVIDDTLAPKKGAPCVRYR